ncbi:MAG TPA: hypothetical protein PKC17_03215 [Geobacter anodireducens]|nr:hypothetical protein [Geobacter anodireducens]
MTGKVLAVAVMVAAGALALGGEAMARGGRGPMAGQGTGDRLQLRDGSCLSSTATAASAATSSRQQLRDGSGTGTARQGVGTGAMRRLGPGDGTGNVTPPQDGMGYGSSYTGRTAQ